MTAAKKPTTDKEEKEDTSKNKKKAVLPKKTADKKPAAKKTAAPKTAAKKTDKKVSPKKPVAKKAKEEELEEEEPRKRKVFFTPAAQVVKPEPVQEEEPAPAAAAPAPEVKAAPAPQPQAATLRVEEKPAEVKPVQPQVQAPVQTAPAPQPQAQPAPVVKPAPVQPAVQPAPAPQPAQPKVQPRAEQTIFNNSVAKPAPVQHQQHYPKPQAQFRPGQKPQHHNKHNQKPQPKPAPKVEEVKPSAPKERVIKIVGSPTVKELAEKMEIKIPDFIKKLMGLGIFATINQRLDGEIIELVVSECGFKAEMASEFAQDALSTAAQEADRAEDLKPRAPVVTIMGHVDHGKTSLLDAVRKSNVVEGEHGAITQHIGAYRVKTNRGYITFLDTPGHEAFTAMRARGAQATDIVILVVSATDGIMPQTVEAMDHAKAAGAPIIVAVNKIDLPGANPDSVKQELAARGLIPEEWQGNTIYVEISAKKRINIDKLLEMVSLQAEMLELKANPNRRGTGIILESKRDNKRGVVATVLVQKGTVKVGDPFIVGTVAGKVRALIDENAIRHQSIGPSVPAEILGINGEPPHVGETFFVTESEREAKHLAEKRKLAHKEDSFAHKKHISLMSLKSEVDQNKIKKLQIVLKGDVQGSIEAIKDSLGRIPSEEVEVQIIHSAAGNINESDILLAKASNAVVIGFNVEAEGAARAEAEREGIEIRLYHIIFELIEDIRAAMEGLLEPDVVEVVTGRAIVRQVFNLSSGIVAGSIVETGTITRGAECKVYRGSEIVFKGRIGGLKRFKEDVKEVEKGYECGILLDGFKAVKEGDVVETYRKDSITRRITM